MHPVPGAPCNCCAGLGGLQRAGLFYAGFAVVGPFCTAYFMRQGQSYEDASGSAGVALMLGGLCWVEAVVELRGCGVTFAQARGPHSAG